MDEDSSGGLSIAEIRARLGENIDEKTYKALLKKYDSNGDGNIDMKEFKSMMREIMNKI